jgi:hypothetical protein
MTRRRNVVTVGIPAGAAIGADDGPHERSTNYSGKVEGETVSGAIEVAGASGSFTGTRAKA